MKKFMFIFINIFILNLVINPNKLISGNLDIKNNIIENNSIDIIESLNTNIYNTMKIESSDYSYKKEEYLKYFEKTDSKIYNFYKERIPEEYFLNFLYFTRGEYSKFRPLIYAIMKHETLNFNFFINTNKNGTIDHGPMMLNSCNIKNEKFMKYFYKHINENIHKELHSSDKEIDKYNYYMIICINYIIYLIDKYKSSDEKDYIIYALRAYNAGEKSNTVYGSANKKIHGTKYAKKVLKIESEILKDFSEYVIDIS